MNNSDLIQIIEQIKDETHENNIMLKEIIRALKIKDEEKLAYLNGDLNMRSYKFIEKLKKKVGSE